MSDVISIGGKGLELVRGVQCYWIDMVGLTSMHCIGTGIKLLDRALILFLSRAAQGVPTAVPAMLAFTPVEERVASLCLRLAGGTVVCAYATNSS